jgi:hypothetical protein
MLRVRSIIRIVAAVLVAGGLFGCFMKNLATPYPPDWPAETAPASTACPIIAGRYMNLGAPSEGLGASMSMFCDHVGYRRPNPNYWDCDYQLGSNLVDDPTFHSARSIEITQPEPGALVISIPEQPLVAPRRLSQSRLDFQCDGSGLTMSKIGNVYTGMNGSSVGDAVMTGMHAMLLAGGIAANSRSFRPLPDGSLLLDVTNSSARVYLFGFAAKGQGFVRWIRDTSATAAGEGEAEKIEP